ncbi:MAG: hypothetical protein HY926_03370 [Elusimicrobia bacterium]|nr:hypothetical protein [Elusimicrobiota bacterium]
MKAALAAALLLAAVPSRAADAPRAAGDHDAPVPSLAAELARDQRRATLNDMWQRGILGTDMNQWSPLDMELLERMRRAEASGALGLLSRRFLSWKGLVLRDRPPGSTATRLRLTRLGFDRYLQIKSQESLAYFERREVETKWAYWLTDLEGRPLFDRGSGLLTEAGDALYSRALSSQPTFWRLRSGEVRGNRPVPPELRQTAAPPPAPPAPRLPAPRPSAPTAVTGVPVVTSTQTAPVRAPAPVPGTAR